MERETKFRGKRLDNGSWVCGNLITTSNEYAFIDTNNELYEDESYLFRDNTDMIRVAVSKVDKNTIGQFTGLHDMSGKETYEGDIVDYVCDGPQQGIIIYDDFGCVSIEFGDDKYLQTINLRLLSLMTVIGNIHDNPELTIK